MVFYQPATLPASPHISDFAVVCRQIHVSLRRSSLKGQMFTWKQWTQESPASFPFPRFTAIKTSALIFTVLHPQTQETLGGNVKSWFKDVMWSGSSCLSHHGAHLSFLPQTSEIPRCFYAHNNISKHLCAVRNPDVQLFMQSSTCPTSMFWF